MFIICLIYLPAGIDKFIECVYAHKFIGGAFLNIFVPLVFLAGWIFNFGAAPWAQNKD